MTRIHDMGGRFGDGPGDPSEGPVFAEDWHARALAVTLAAGALGQWTLHTSRHARECLSPADYARFPYYEKWLAALADLLARTGTVTRAELAGGEPSPSHLAARRLAPEAVAPALARGAPTDRDGSPARFGTGDRVRTRRPSRNAHVTGGHTRLPAYACGQTGTVVLVHGPHVLPDTNAHGLGERPEPLYTVAFAARDLWGPEAGARDEVRLDLWDSYLSPA